MSQLNPEAIKESREALHNDQSPGATALHSAVLAFENGWYANFPAPKSQEAQDLLDQLKPARYAAIASTIDLMLEMTFEESKDKGYSGNPTSQYSYLEEYFTTRFVSSLSLIKQTEPFLYYDRVRNFTCYLIEKDTTVTEHLYSGVNTAKETNLSILKLFPELIRYYAPDTPRDTWGNIAKNSPSMSYSLSRSSIERMMAGREVAVCNPDPTNYQPIYNNNKLMTFKFNDLDKQVIPKDSVYWQVKSSEDPPTVGGIVSDSKVIIGCPLTLLSGRLRQLWEWMAETVDKSGVWDTEDDSSVSFAGAAEGVNL